MQPALLDPAKARDAHILDRLQSDVIAWFGSMRPDGRPHFVPVWFLWEQGTILVFSQPNQKVRNIEQNPSVILALDNTHDGADVIEIEGQAHLVADASALAPAYLAKYGTRIAALGYTPEQMAQAYSKAIRVIPTRFF
jgi:PPOX class probable F420-dependent enzyme